jgi:hypothetical protein
MPLGMIGLGRIDPLFVSPALRCQFGGHVEKAVHEVPA